MQWKDDQGNERLVEIAHGRYEIFSRIKISDAIMIKSACGEIERE